MSKLNKVLAAESINQRKALAISAGEIGTAMLLNPIELAFLNHHLDDSKGKKATSIAETMLEELSSKGLSLTISGKTYEGDEMKKHLKDMEKSWKKDTLPRMQEMGCV